MSTYVEARHHHKKACEHWCQRFNCCDFVTGRNRPLQANKFEEAKLQDFLEEDSSQTQLDHANQDVQEEDV